MDYKRHIHSMNGTIKKWKAHRKLPIFLLCKHEDLFVRILCSITHTELVKQSNLEYPVFNFGVTIIDIA